MAANTQDAEEDELLEEPKDTFKDVKDEQDVKEGDLIFACIGKIIN